MNLSSPQKLWIILRTHSDEFEFNGELDLSRSFIPGIRCHICGETWADTSPAELDLPEGAQSKIPKHAPLELSEYLQLRDELTELIGLDREAKMLLRPGCSFNPTAFICRAAKAPSVASLGGHLIVSREVIESLEKNCGLESARWRRLQAFNANGKGTEDRYVMLRTNGRLRPQNWVRRALCKACGSSEWSRGSFDDFPFDEEREFQKLKMPKEATIHGDVWTLESTSYYVVSDRIYKTLTRFAPAIEGVSLG